jgi:hypothetical protein
MPIFAIVAGVVLLIAAGALLNCYLLANRGLSIELDRDTLAIVFDSRLKPDAIEPNLGRLVEVRRRLPDLPAAAR